jgi:uncharacterized membrane protein YkgB
MSTDSMVLSATRPEGLGGRIQLAGELLIRYGLVLVLLWIGAMKFTAYEAKGIEPLVASSPLMGWLYHALSLQGVSNLIGVTEIVTAVLIALRPLSTKLAAAGSCLAILTFLTTLTFLFTLPGWEESLGGFPALSGAGGFLLKDAVLLGASVWSLGEALSGAEKGRRAKISL